MIFLVPKKTLSYGPVKHDNSLADWFTKKCVVSMSNEHLIHIHSTLVKIHRHRIWDFCICNSTAFSVPFLKSYDLACLGKVSAKERVRKRHTQCSAGTPWFKKEKSNQNSSSKNLFFDTLDLLQLVRNQDLGHR